MSPASPQRIDSRCCASPLSDDLRTERLALRRCSGCGTLWATHQVEAQGSDAWESEGITPEFLRALKSRRERQALAILDHFPGVSTLVPVLDYGCGQGAFLSQLLARGIEAYGCDVSGSVQGFGGVRRDRLLRLKGPWELPEGIEFRTVVLLDVLEHCAEPGRFLGTLRERRVEQCVIKVPLTAGPLFKAARLLAQLGRAQLFEALFLVGDVSPHQAYFSRRGVVRLLERYGFRCAKALTLAEVGRELPDRVRLRAAFGPSASAMRWPAFRTTVGLMGLSLEAVGAAWSDAAVFCFRRATS